MGSESLIIQHSSYGVNTAVIVLLNGVLVAMGNFVGIVAHW